jgi:hypothetical protein
MTTVITGNTLIRVQAVDVGCTILQEYLPGFSAMRIGGRFRVGVIVPDHTQEGKAGPLLT